MKDVYRLNQKEIVNWIKKRLRTQDRISGVKVWLLMRTILKLLGSTWFDEWCRSIIDNTWVLVDNQGKYIRLNRVDELILMPNPNGNNSVWIVVGDQEYQVYTRTTQNGIPGPIDPLDVKKIGDVSLDHKKAIDSTLRDLGNQNKLSELNKISDIAKHIKDAICVESGYDIDKNIIVCGNRIESSNPVASAVIDLDELRKEMDFIKNDTKYELMDGSQNGKKNTRGASEAPSTNSHTISTLTENCSSNISVSRSGTGQRDLPNSSSRRQYTINGTGNYSMYDVMGKFAIYRMGKGDTIDDVNELAKDYTNSSICFFSDDKTKVFRYQLQKKDGSYSDHTYKFNYQDKDYYSTKEMKGKEKGNFTKLMNKINKNFTDFQIVEV